jgi:DNA-directed RNA polymerase specialized sigma24 family protein
LQRRVVFCRVIEGLSNEETARRLGIPVSRASTLYQEALNLLSNLLQD